MTSVLITAASTPIGRKLVRHFLDSSETQHVVAVLNGERTPFVRDPRFHEVIADLTRPREVHKLLFGIVRELEVDVVVHLAMHRSLSATGKKAHALNVGTLEEMLHMLARHPTVRRFVFRSCAEVYRSERERSVLIDESHPLNFDANAPQWIRDRVEADVLATTAMGMGPLDIVVTRIAECVAPACGSQLYDYLEGPICFRPIGFDPMLNIISVADAARALVLAAEHEGNGVFNIPGQDTLPLSELIHLFGRTEIPASDRLLDLSYGLRARLLGTEFRYQLNRGRFHLGGVLDGRRAEEMLGYVPENAIEWPSPKHARAILLPFGKQIGAAR